MRQILKQAHIWHVSTYFKGGLPAGECTLNAKIIAEIVCSGPEGL